MSAIKDISNPWRDRIVAIHASFRDVVFHIETDNWTSGRRTVLHEYPKRDQPYAEDMGRHAQRLQITGYLIYRPSNPVYVYMDQRNALVAALEGEGAGMLYHPVHCPMGLLVMCDRYSMTETREKGGYTTFEMSFVEAGSPGNSVVSTNPATVVLNNASVVEAQASTEFNFASAGPFSPNAFPPVT